MEGTSDVKGHFGGTGPSFDQSISEVISNPIQIGLYKSTQLFVILSGTFFWGHPVDVPREEVSLNHRRIFLQRCD